MSALLGLTVGVLCALVTLAALRPQTDKQFIATACIAVPLALAVLFIIRETL